MALRVHIDETSCGALCQHPACWHSNTRQDKGFPRLRPRPPSPPDIELDLPTLKVCNMLEDYGEDPKDKFPSKFGGKPAHERHDYFVELHKPIRAQSVKVTRAPQTSPKSGTTSLQPPQMSKFKVVEVQEVFDPEDLQGTWDDTFVPKSYYVWVPNNKKKRRKQKLAQSEDKNLNRKNKVDVKDLTESMVPKEIENMRLTSRKKRAQTRSPVYMRPYTMTPRTTMVPSRMEFDQEGISELLDLPRDILVQVLENTRQSDLMSREKIREIIRRFMPPQLERGNTNISLASQDLLQQKKLNLHEGNKNVRQPHLMETKPVFYLDDDMVDEVEDEDLQRPGSPYGSLKDLYFGGAGNSTEFNKYKKPLPAIHGTSRAVSAGENLHTTKIPSISLGLPELPSGIRQTKPFTYNKKIELDFTLAPVPTPPTSIRSTGTPGSDHGTTIRVNVPSQASVRSEHGSEGRRDSYSTATPEPLHAVSPSFSTRVPIAPATTPATYQAPSSKSAPLLRDMTGSTIANTPQEWPSREKTSSPLQILRAPVNTPGSVMQDTGGLGTIHEAAPTDNGEPPLPMSRGRSVRFEIPEVPPPPSSPQLSDDGQKDPSRNAVTVNTNIPQETPSNSTTKPMSGATMRTDINTVNTSTMMAENSFVRSQAGPMREVSLLSSPEPWPQVNEADYEKAPVPSPETLTHETSITTTDIPESQSEYEKANQSKNAHTEREPIIVPSPDKDTAENTTKGGYSSKGEYVNKVDGHSEAVKKLMEDSRKAESPAPPPPSPEPKQDSNLSASKKNKAMTPLIEENETPRGDTEDSEMTVVQIAPKGARPGGRKLNNRQIDTFQNIDIPATFDDQKEPTPSHLNIVPDPTTETIMEEPEREQNEIDENNKENRDVALSVQSTLANRTISEQAHSEVSSSMIEPAISQASQAPALSEDFSERHGNSELLGDWTGVVVGSEGQETTAMVSSDKQDQEMDMTEEGGDHEGFKEDLRQEYERLKQETESSETPAES